jgi:peptidyl-tRNA hydrolase
MKQYVVINKSLGMSKGKIARVCLSCGCAMNDIVSFTQRCRWIGGGMTAVILTTEDFELIIEWLKLNKIKHYIHVDAGRTQVERGSRCGVTFFHEGNEDLDKLKLY